MATVASHCKDTVPKIGNKYLEMKLHSFILVFSSDLYIPTIGTPIWLQQNRWTDPGNIEIAHRYKNV